MRDFLTRLSSQSWLRYLGLAAAGLMAFAIAALSSGPSERDASHGSIVGPSERVEAVAARPDMVRVLIHTQGDGPDVAVAPGPQISERLSSRVTHNPFASLGLKTGMAAMVGAKPAGSVQPSSAPSLKNPSAGAAQPVPPPAPPIPRAPPLPFTAIGAIAGEQVTNGLQVAFVRQQDQLLLIRAGDLIGQSYRVDSITEQKIEFTYLPLMQRQALALAP